MSRRHLAVIGFAVLGLCVSGPSAHPATISPAFGERRKDKDDDKTIAAEKAFEVIKKRWDESRDGEIQDRLLTLSEFANAPCSRTVQFLGGLYTSEDNPGIHMEATKVLGKIGTEAAIKYVILEGLPLLSKSSFDVTAVAEALENSLDGKAEQWFVRTGLKAQGLRKYKETWRRVLGAVAKFENPLRVNVLVSELLRPGPGTDSEAMVTILESLEEVADRKLVSVATKLLRHKSAEVQTAAMSLLLTQGGPRQRKLFEKGVKSRHWQVRLLSLRTLARLKHKKILKYATNALEDPDRRVQITAVRVLLRRGGKEVLLPLIQRIDAAEGRVKDDILDALTRLTGEDFGPSTFQWEGWWQTKGTNLRTFEMLGADEFAALKQKQQLDQKTVAYHGLRILSNNFTFVIDTSESMMEEYVPITRRQAKSGRTTPVGPAKVTKRKKSKIAVAKEQLKKALYGLPLGKSFDIIRFESDIRDFIRDALGGDAKRLKKLDEPTRTKAIAFVDECRPQGQTYMLKALDQAFANEDVDTIYLLSDGAPTPVETSGMDVILARMRKLNRVRCVKINTIGFHLKTKEKEFLRKLADEHFGVFVER